MTQDSATKERALTLLGQGLDAKVVAAALGISDSRVSQLLSQEEFSTQVSELRFKNLSAHTERDNRYDTLEGRVLEKLEDQVDFVSSPVILMKLLQTLNGAKRRGASAPASLEKPSESVPLILPVLITNQFVTNINNQVIKAGLQELVTVQSSAMGAMLAASKSSRTLPYETSLSPPP